MTVLFNEIDPYAAAWLRNLCAANLIAPGRVDERSIVDLKPEDLAGVVQGHFFSGIGVWSAALRDAGWPDDCPVWSGSCPCQGFSTAGRKKGFDDERHLWPVFFNLIRECRPPVIVGEQVASPDVIGPTVAKARRKGASADRGTWLDLVHDDLEAASYSVGAIVLPACGVGAPHIRQRLFFVALDTLGGLDDVRYRLRAARNAVTDGERREGERVLVRERGSRAAVPQVGGRGATGGLADAERDGRGPRRDGVTHGRASVEPDRHGATRLMAHAEPDGLQDRIEAGTASRATWGPGDPTGDARLVGHPGEPGTGRDDRAVPGAEGEGAREGYQYWRLPHGVVPPGPTRGYWADAEWILCRDGKARPIEPGTSVLVAGTSGRVVVRRAGREHEYPRAAALRGFGNAIVRPAAATFIESVIDVILERP